MSERSLRIRFHRFISRYKRLEQQKRHLLKLYFDSQTMMQIHYANIVKMVNIMNLDVLENFNHSQEFLLNNTLQGKVGRLQRFSRFWEYEVPASSEEEFKTNFRMSRKSFEKLCNKLQFLTKQDTNKQKAIPLRKRIAVSLYALGCTQEYKAVAHLFGIGRSTIREIVLEFATAVSQKLYVESIVGYPASQRLIEHVVEGFERNFGIPQCYGAAGTCHIRIISPNKSEPYSSNSEGWHSIVVFAVTDSRGRFTYLSTDNLGNATDSYIFENSLKLTLSEFKSNELFMKNSKTIENTKVPIFLVGGTSLPLARYLMTPYLDSECESKRCVTYNRILTECEQTLNTAFDDVRARFRKVGKGFDARVSNCATIVKACCIIHNFLKWENDPVLESWSEEFIVREKSRGINQPKRIPIMEQNDMEAEAIRDALASYLDRKRCSSVNWRNDTGGI